MKTRIKLFLSSVAITLGVFACAPAPATASITAMTSFEMEQGPFKVLCGRESTAPIRITVTAEAPGIYIADLTRVCAGKV